MLRSGGVTSLGSIKRGFNTHDPWYIISSDEFKKMRKEFEKYQKMTKDISVKSEEREKCNSDIFEKYVEKQANKQLGAPGAMIEMQDLSPSI